MNDWKKWSKKLGLGLALASVTGLLIMWQNDPKYVILMPVLLALQNYLKHR